jgi:hypothetical protein
MDYFNAGFQCSTGQTLTFFGPESIVIPVHVHVLASRSGQLPSTRIPASEWEDFVRRWIDPTGSEVGGFFEIHHQPPDATWMQAGIRLHLASPPDVFPPTGSIAGC